MNDQLVPRQPKRKRQPTAAVMREQLRLAADEIIRLKTVIDSIMTLKGWQTKLQQTARVEQVVRAGTSAIDFPRNTPRSWLRRLFRTRS